MTYLSSWEGVTYLAFIIDFYSRMIVGWQLAEHMRTTLVLDALRMAVGTRGPGAQIGLVHHSDQGSQKGGFKWSSQRSMKEGCDGQAEGVGVGSDRAADDAVAGASVGRASGASAAVLGSDRWRRVECRGGRGRGGVGDRWRPSAVASALRELASAMTDVADAIEKRPAREPLAEGAAEPLQPNAQ
jgi:Integrase core domain